MSFKKIEDIGVVDSKLLFEASSRDKAARNAILFPVRLFFISSVQKTDGV